MATVYCHCQKAIDNRHRQWPIVYMKKWPKSPFLLFVAVLPNERVEHLRYVCNHVLTQPFGLRTETEIMLIREIALHKMYKQEPDRLLDRIQEAQYYSQRAKFGDPFLTTLQHYLEGVMKYAVPSIIIDIESIPKREGETMLDRMKAWSRLPMQIIDVNERQQLPTIEYIYDSFTEWAALKLHFTMLQYLQNYYPILHNLPEINVISAKEVLPYAGMVDWSRVQETFGGQTFTG